MVLNQATKEPVDAPGTDLDSLQKLSLAADNLVASVEASPPISPPKAEGAADLQHYELTPIRAHYLKKSLVSLEFSSELKALSNSSSNPKVSLLSYLGPPFTAPLKGSEDVHDLPFFQFLFRQFFLTFPFFAGAPKNFFPQKLQPFIDSLLARNLTGGYNAVVNANEADEDELGRQKIMGKLEKQLSVLLGSSIKLVEREDFVRLTQLDLDRLEVLAKRRRERVGKIIKDVFEVNVVGVRTVIEKKKIRSRSHDEFIVRTRRTDFPDIFVPRRFGDFKTLWETLRKAHPEEAVLPPPGKDRSATTSTYGTDSGPSTPVNEEPSWSSKTESSGPPLTRTATMASTISSSTNQVKLSREKNRLTLRYYLNALLCNSVLASSPVLRSFLTANPIKLTQREIQDVQNREEADRLREQGREKFQSEVRERVDRLRDGLSAIFAIIRSTPNAQDLPAEYKAVVEWGRVSLAYTIFQQLIAADSASETFATLKRLHGLMPYMVMKGILRISNPVAMIRGVLDLFTAQPFGGRSLLQRMFTSSLAEEAKVLQDDVNLVSEKIEDPIMCEKLRQYVYAPREIQDFYKAEAAATGSNILTVILRSSEAPTLNRAQMQRLAKCSRAHMEYAQRRDSPSYDSDDDEGPPDEDGWLYEDLGVLLRLYGRLRDKEQLMELIFESTTADLLKDIITIFYSPLAQVYRAASVADSLGDLQTFINDLIATVERVNQTSDESPNRTVQTFIDLVQRHEQAFYYFVYKVHTKGEGLFDSLSKWIELFLAFMRDGLGQNFSLEYVLPHKGPDRTAILKEVDTVALYHYKLKVAYQERVRRKFDNRPRNQLNDAENEAAQELVEEVMGDMSLGALVGGDLSELNDESSDDDSSTDSETSTEAETSRPHTQPSSPPAQRTTLQPLERLGSTQIPPGEGSTHSPQPSTISQKSREPSRSRGPSGVSTLKRPTPQRNKGGKGGPPILKEPELKHIPTVLPLFLEMIRPSLRPRVSTTY